MTSTARELRSVPRAPGLAALSTRHLRRNVVTAASIVVIGLLLGISYASGRFADQRAGRSDLAVARELIYLPRPATARVMSLGFQQLVADWYWVRAQQYFTEPAQEINQYRSLGDFLDVVIGVDPDFEYVYKFGGIATPYDTGRLRYANTERAIGFLQRGVERFPQNWEMRLYLGFYLLNFRGDSAGAAEQFARAAPIPGAPQYLKRFAARLFSVSGEVERAKAFTEQMLAITQEPDERARLETRLQEIELEGRMREVEAAAAQFRTEHGRWPAGLEELAAARPLPPLPAHARLEDGTVTAPEVKRLVVYEHPKEAPMRSAK